MLIVAMPVLLAVMIMVAAVGWARRHGTLHPSEQELVEVEFERIVRGFEVPIR